MAFCGQRTNIVGILKKMAGRADFTCAHGPAPPPQSSSICRAAIHYGILGNEGGLVDITRNGKAPFFVKSKRNGVESLR